MIKYKNCAICSNLFEQKGNKKYCWKEIKKSCPDCDVEIVTHCHPGERSFCLKCAKENGNKRQSIIMKKKFETGEMLGYRDPAIQAKAREAIKEKYGVENPSQIPEVKEKIRKTNIKKFGGASPFASEEVQKKIRATNLERYGAENVFNSPEIQERIKETFKERYGVESALQHKEFFDKQRKSLKEKYGVEVPLKNPDILAKQQATVQRKYGVNNSAKIDFVRKNSRDNNLFVTDENFIAFVRNFNANNDSKVSVNDLVKQFNYASESPVYKRIRLLGLSEEIDFKYSSVNEKWRDLIHSELGVLLEREGNIFGNKKWRCDLFSVEHKVAVDINPTISHSTQKAHPFFIPKAVKYHQDRALSAESNGWLLYQIYDWTDEELALKQLANLFHLNSNRVFARQCKIVRPSKETVKDFLDVFHLQKGSAVGNIFFGLEFEGELVQVMTFSKERFRGSKNGFELIRLASDGTVVGGASRLFKAFIREFDPERVKTFASLDTGHGKVYEKMGFVFEGLAGLNAFYANPVTLDSIKVTRCTQLFRKEYESLGLTQKEYMNSKGYFRINDAGNKIFVWSRYNNSNNNDSLLESEVF